MKKYILTLTLGLIFFVAKSQSLSDKLAEQYCDLLSVTDTVSLMTFEEWIQFADDNILFKDPEMVLTIAEEIEEQESSYYSFYTELYNKFSISCPAYQALYKTSDIKLKDPDFFTNAYCECFDKELEGKIDGASLTPVMEACNEQLSKNRAYKRKVKKELKNKDLSEENFSKIITGNFLSQCSIIVNHMFSDRVKTISINTHFLVLKQKIDAR
ncbi:MAG: hypothetical protein ACK4ND_17095 [Cytophagaceae bacterium]